MPLSITFADLADGSGTTASVLGTGGASVEVFVQVVNGGGWSSAGTRVGDGDLLLVLPVGLRWGYARIPGEQTAPVSFVVTGGGGLSLATRCRDAVIATVQALSLDGCRGVIEKPYPDPANADFPVVWISTDGVRETVEAGLNATNDIGYPVRVLIVDRHELRDKSRLRERYEPWREAIIEAFLDKRLAGVPESVQCLIEPLPVLDPNLPQYQFVVSGVVVRCRTRKTR